MEKELTLNAALKGSEVGPTDSWWQENPETRPTKLSLSAWWPRMQC
jgi:hypothetical protein